MKKLIGIALALLLTKAGPALAGNCTKLQLHLNEVAEELVTAFKEGDITAIDEAKDNLVFWDAYYKIECPGDETPIDMLGKRGSGQKMSPYLAGFLLWMEKLEKRGIYMTPAGLVRGRTFK